MVTLFSTKVDEWFKTAVSASVTGSIELFNSSVIGPSEVDSKPFSVGPWLSWVIGKLVDKIETGSVKKVDSDSGEVNWEVKTEEESTFSVDAKLVVVAGSSDVVSWLSGVPINSDFKEVVNNSELMFVVVSVDSSLVS